MTRVIARIALAAMVVGMTAGTTLAQQTTTTTKETKSFEIIAVDGNRLDVRMPEGTRELTVPDDFRFNVNGQQLSVRELTPGMKGTATITTNTTVTPVTVTEVKNGTVLKQSGSSIIVRSDDGVRMFSQGELDKRGVKMMREGKPAEVSDFHEGDRLTATIITTKPPKVMTEKQVNAMVPTTAKMSDEPARTPAASGTSAHKAPVSSSSSAPSSSSMASGQSKTLPKTASSRPLFAFASVLSLAVGLALTVRRRFVS
jgi:membrane anchored protein